MARRVLRLQVLFRGYDRLEPCLNHIGFLVTPRRRFAKEVSPCARARRKKRVLSPVILFYIEGIVHIANMDVHTRLSEESYRPLILSLFLHNCPPRAERPRDFRFLLAPGVSLFSVLFSFSFSLSLSFFPYVSSGRGPPPILRTGAGGRPRCSKSSRHRRVSYGVQIASRVIIFAQLADT